MTTALKGLVTRAYGVSARAEGIAVGDYDAPPPSAYADECDAAPPSTAIERVEQEREKQAAHGPQPLDVPPVSTWSDRAPPQPRDWICEALAIPAGRVATLGGNGGCGKSTIATQLAVSTAASRELWGSPVAGGTVLGIFCEDDRDEIDRRTRGICDAEGLDLAELDNLHLLSRDGEDNVIATFERDLIRLTAFYAQIEATVALLKPRLTILDTAADMFAGDFMSTPHVRQFIKVALGGLCVRHGTAVLLLAHPSMSAMSTGDGGGFSTAWNNSVRARLYLRKPKTDDAEAASDRRVLEVKKSNYGPAGGILPLVYDRGRFILDPDPIEEGTRPAKAPRADMGLGLAVMTYFRAKAPSGEVVSFKALLEGLQAAGDLPPGTYEQVRKPLQRTLKDLVAATVIRTSEVPRGYRIHVRSDS